MPRFIKAAFTALFIVSLNLPLAAQSDPPQKKPANEKSAAANTKSEMTLAQRRALELLDQLFDVAKALDDESLKLRLQGQIADALWEYDEDRARAQFESIFRAISVVKAPSSENRLGISPDLSLQISLRYELMGMIERRDPSLAKRLIDSLPSLSPSANSDPALKRQTEMNQGQLYLSLARKFVQTDPQQAVKIAETYLQGSVFSSFTVLLYELQRQDEHLANYLFNRALTAFYESPQKSLPHLTTLALYVLPGYGDMSERRNFIQQMGPTISLIGHPLNQAQLERAQRLLNYVHDILMQPANSHYQNYDLASQTLYYFEQYLPDKASDVRARLEEAMSLFPPEQRRNLRGPALPQTTQSILAQAESATSKNEKDRLYPFALSQAVSDGNIELALSIAAKMSDQQSRENYRSSVRYQAAFAATRKGDFEMAYIYAKGVTGLASRANLLTQLARALHQNKDTTRALEIINEAEQWLVKAESGPEQAMALLEIAGVAAEMDPSRGFEMTKTAVEAVNLADKSLNQNSSAAAIATINRLNFEQSFSALARTNFDRALLLAQSLEKRDFMLRAQLAVCRGVLIIPPEDKAKSKEAEKSEKDQQTDQSNKTQIKKTDKSK